MTTATTITGTTGSDQLNGGAGADVIDGGAGSDRINGGSGNDTVNGGAGSDIVSGGSGNDVAIYVAAENRTGGVSFTDIYDGGSGTDTIRLVLTRDEWMSGALQSDLANYLRFISTNTLPIGDANNAEFRFTAFDLRVSKFEAIEVVVDGVAMDPRDSAVVLGNDTIHATEDAASLAIDVLANDSVADGVKSLTHTQAAHGSLSLDLSLAAAGSSARFVYTPDVTHWQYLAAGETATDSFTYTVTDANGDVSTATVTVTIRGTNDGPSLEAGVMPGAQEDGGAVTLDLTTLGDDVDGDDDGASLVYTIAEQPSAGTASIDADRLLSFLPGMDFQDLALGETREVTIAIRATDGQGASTTNTVTVTVTGTNDTPVVEARMGDSAGTAEALTEADAGAALTTSGTLTITDADLTDTVTATVHSVVTEGPTGGLDAATLLGFFDVAPATLDADAGTASNLAWAFDPGAQAFDFLADGQVLTLRYRVRATDDSGTGNNIGDGIVTIRIRGTNDGPVAEGDSAQVDEDDAVVVDVLGNDSDVDGGTPAVTAIDGQAVAEGGAVAVEGGKVTLRADGQLVFRPNGDYNGSPSFTYTITDGQGGTDTATVQVTVNPVNDAPVARNDADGDTLVEQGVDVAGNAAASGNLLLNDSDVDAGDQLSVASVSGGGTIAVAADGAMVVRGTYGTLTVNADGSWTYLLDDADGDTEALGAGEVGQEVFTYTISDGQGGFDSAALTLDIQGSNDNRPPVAVGETAAVREDGALVLTSAQILGNDSDPEGDPITLASINATAVVAGQLTIIDSAHGTITVAGDGTIIFQPDANWSGTETFTYTISDGFSQSQAATITVDVFAAADAPTVKLTGSGTEDQPVALDLGIALADTDGSEAVTQVRLSGYPAGATFSLGQLVDGGWVIGAADLPALATGGLTMTPPANWNGSFALGVQVSVRDSAVLSGGSVSTSDRTFSHSFDVAVAAVNDAPVAQDTTVELSVDMTSSGRVIASDIDGDVLSYAVVDGPENGTLNFSEDGRYTYAPAAGYLGLDRFDVLVKDGKGGEVITRINLEVERQTFTSPGGQTASLVLDGDGSDGGAIGGLAIDVSTLNSSAINISFALDGSGSLGATAWQQQINAVGAAIRALYEQFQGSATDVDIQIVTFATDLVKNQTFALETATNGVPAAATFVEGLLYPRGYTNWEVAFEAAEGFFDSQLNTEENFFYFITDGQPNVPSTSPQDWEGALASLKNQVENGYKVNIEAFGIGSAFDANSPELLEVDPTPTLISNTSVLANALSASPLFAVQLVNFSLELVADGVARGEIADETSSALKPDGLNFDLSLADVSGIEGLLGASNRFTATATFDLDGKTATTSDRVSLYSTEVISKKASAVDLTGTDGNDLLLGSDGADRLAGGKGNDVLLGFAGADTFVLRDGDGADVVAGFQAGLGAGDVLDLRGVAALAGGDLTAVLARATQVGSDTVISLGDGQGGNVTLLGVQLSQFAADDFLL